MNRSRPLPILRLATTAGLLLLAQCGPAAAAADPQDPPASASSAERIHLLVSGSLHGRLEPCGCASGQLGGLPRRMQHIGEQRAYDLLVEGGDLVAGASELDLQKATTALTVLFGMQRPYDALGVGQNDLRLPLAEWSAFAAIAPVVATDLASGAPEWPGKPFVEKEVRGKKVRLLSFVLQLPENLQRPDAPVRLVPPAEAYAQGLAGAEPTTLRIVLVHATDIATRALLDTLAPKPDLALCFDPAYGEPPAHPELHAGVPIVYPGTRGRMLLDVSLVRLPEGPRVGYEIVPLQGSRTVPGGGGDPDVQVVLRNHRDEVKQDDLLSRMARQRPTGNGAEYVGTDACAACHETADAAWRKTRHAGAWATLQQAEQDPKRYGWPVTAYPDCVACHVVGYGEQSGFVNGKATPELANVGCETCHGAGSKHVESMGKHKLGKVGAGTPSVVCAQCHDAEQSPTFVYGEKWPKIEHGLDPQKK